MLGPTASFAYLSAAECAKSIAQVEAFRAGVTEMLRASSEENLVKVRAAEELVLAAPQVEVATEHLFHAGMYARTIRLQAGVVLAGALVKIATILIMNGMADVWTGESWERIGGYSVLAGDAFRKQVFVTRSAVELTMVFPTGAKTVVEAEREFTDEYERLMSRRV